MEVAQTDVLVIGGGIAGCFAAISVARSGKSVAILDKATLRCGDSVGPRMDHVALGVHPEALSYDEAVQYVKKTRMLKY